MQTVHTGPRHEAPLLSCDQIRAIHDAALRIEHPLASLVQIAPLLPCDTAVMARAPLELADRAQRTMTVCSAEEFWYDIAIGEYGWKAVERASGGWRFGPVVAGEDGGAFVVDETAEARALLLVAAIDPKTIAVGWSFRSLQASILHHMRRAGVPKPVLDRQLATVIRSGDPVERAALLREQTISADMWAGMLQLWTCPPGSTPERDARVSFEVIAVADVEFSR